MLERHIDTNLKLYELILQSSIISLKAFDAQSLQILKPRDMYFKTFTVVINTVLL